MEHSGRIPSLFFIGEFAFYWRGLVRLQKKSKHEEREEKVGVDEKITVF